MAAREWGRAIRAIAVPLAFVAAAFGLWWLGDQLGSVGPLDKAAFGWAVVIPLWLAAPVAAGWAWARLTRHGAISSALGLSAVVGVAAAILLWRATTGIDCAGGPTRTPAEWIVPSLVIGAGVGAVPALAGLAAVVPVRERRWMLGVVLGAGGGLVLTFAVMIGSFALFFAGPGCQRPS